MVETKIDWDDLRLFLAVARGSGLADARRVTGKSAPTLGRRMLALEKALGQELFARKPRGYDLTEAGQALFDRALDVEARMLPLLQPPHRRARPVVKVSAGKWMTHVLCRNVAQIVENGDVLVRFIAADHVLDLRHREAVVGIRNQRPEQIGLACQKLGPVRFAVYARDPKVELWARVQGQTPSARWVAAHAGAADVIEVTDPRNALDLALAGSARAVLPTFIGALYPDLRQIGETIDDLTHDQWLVSHDEDRFEPNVRIVIRRLVRVLHALER